MDSDQWKERGLSPDSIAKYNRFVGRLIEWLRTKRMLFRDVKEINVDHIELFLSDQKKLHNYGNREYNNSYDFIRTAFNFGPILACRSNSFRADTTSLICCVGCCAFFRFGGTCFWAGCLFGCGWEGRGWDCLFGMVTDVSKVTALSAFRCAHFAWSRERPKSFFKLLE